MSPTSFWRQKLACAYFFIAPALMYGAFTSRLPAIKAQIAADDQLIGYLLLSLGVSTLLGLLASGYLINKFGARGVTALACPVFFISMGCLALCHTWQGMAIFCLITGLGVGICDVGMNALGIALEKESGKLCLAFLHGCSGIGGVAGSLAGSAFAALGFSPFINLTLLLGIYLLGCFPAYRTLDPFQSAEAAHSNFSLKHISRFIWYCGFMCLICHIAEGSAGEWGSILLHSIKGAPQQEAALVFAFFTGALVITRFATDSLRSRVSDYAISLYGSLIGAAGMALALVSPWPSLCLAGYALMGAGLAPIVPILFSRAGAVKGVSPAQASAIVSILSYAGLLLFPPVLGIFANIAGLTPVLWSIVALCLIMAIFCPPLKSSQQ